LEQGLAGEHEVEIVIRLDVEDFEDLVEHSAVLCGSAHNGAKFRRPGPEVENERREFDGFRARSENQQNSLHEVSEYPRP
jgi:hypothetical protein